MKQRHDPEILKKVRELQEKDKRLSFETCLKRVYRSAQLRSRWQ
ncbi:hypothetical protein [Vibrio aestuarianus]|nr:hypothetical protein [Vibrio aestuarianus]